MVIFGVGVGLHLDIVQMATGPVLLILVAALSYHALIRSLLYR